MVAKSPKKKGIDCSEVSEIGITGPEVQSLLDDELFMFSREDIELVAKTLGQHSLGYLLRRDKMFADALVATPWLTQQDSDGVVVIRSDSLILEDLSSTDVLDPIEEGDTERIVSQYTYNNMFTSSSLPALKMPNPLVKSSLSFCSSGYYSLHSVSVPLEQVLQPKRSLELPLETPRLSEAYVNNWKKETSTSVKTVIEKYEAGLPQSVCAGFSKAEIQLAEQMGRHSLGYLLQRDRRLEDALAEESWLTQIDQNGVVMVLSDSFVVEELSTSDLTDAVDCSTNVNPVSDSMNSIDSTQQGYDLSLYIPNKNSESEYTDNVQSTESALSTLFPPSTSQSGDSEELSPSKRDGIIPTTKAPASKKDTDVESMSSPITRQSPGIFEAPIVIPSITAVSPDVEGNCPTDPMHEQYDGAKSLHSNLEYYDPTLPPEQSKVPVPTKEWECWECNAIMVRQCPAEEEVSTLSRAPTEVEHSSQAIVSSISCPMWESLMRATLSSPLTVVKMGQRLIAVPSTSVSSVMESVSSTNLMQSHSIADWDVKSAIPSESNQFFEEVNFLTNFVEPTIPSVAQDLHLNSTRFLEEEEFSLQFFEEENFEFPPSSQQDQESSAKKLNAPGRRQVLQESAMPSNLSSRGFHVDSHGLCLVEELPFSFSAPSFADEKEWTTPYATHCEAAALSPSMAISSVDVQEDTSPQRNDSFFPQSLGHLASNAPVIIKMALSDPQIADVSTYFYLSPMDMNGSVSTPTYTLAEETFSNSATVLSLLLESSSEGTNLNLDVDELPTSEVECLSTPSTNLLNGAKSDISHSSYSNSLISQRCDQPGNQEFCSTLVQFKIQEVKRGNKSWSRVKRVFVPLFKLMRCCIQTKSK